jgi:hypothetical protein
MIYYKYYIFYIYKMDIIKLGNYDRAQLLKEFKHMDWLKHGHSALGIEETVENIERLGAVHMRARADASPITKNFLTYYTGEYTSLGEYGQAKKQWEAARVAEEEAAAAEAARVAEAAAAEAARVAEEEAPAAEASGGGLSKRRYKSKRVIKSKKRKTMKRRLSKKRKTIKRRLSKKRKTIKRRLSKKRKLSK